MSDLREALENCLGTLPVMSENGYPVQALPKSELLDLLAMHPAEPVTVPADGLRCSTDAHEAHGVVARHGAYWCEGVLAEISSEAAEADPETGFTRPLLDREAAATAIVASAVSTSDLGGAHFVTGTANDFADAVMELARPMPTQRQIEQAIDASDLLGCGCCGGGYDYDKYESRSEALAALVLAMLNGAES